MLECETKSVDVSFSASSFYKQILLLRKSSRCSASLRALIPGLQLFKERIILLDFVTLNTNLANPNS